MRWALVIFIILLLLITAMPSLKRFGLGRLPGDIHFRILGREIELPCTRAVSTFCAISLGLAAV